MGTLALLVFPPQTHPRYALLGFRVQDKSSPQPPLMGEMRFQLAGSCRRQISLLTRVRRVGSRRRRKKACRGTFRLLRAHQRVGNACRANGRSSGSGAPLGERLPGECRVLFEADASRCGFRGGPAKCPGLLQARSLGALGLAWEPGSQPRSQRSSWSSWQRFWRPLGFLGVPVL